MKLYNVSNHPSSKWSPEQVEAAKALVNGGDIVDVPFPNVPPREDFNVIESLADGLVDRITGFTREPPAVAMVQGEFTLSFALITRLKALGWTVVAATTERVVEEADGKKTAVFKFVRFREFM